VDVGLLTELFVARDADVSTDDLDSSAISSAAGSWAETDELSCEPADVEPVIQQLVSLARSFDDPGLGLFLWTST